MLWKYIQQSRQRYRCVRFFRRAAGCRKRWIRRCFRPKGWTGKRIFLLLCFWAVFLFVLDAHPFLPAQLKKLISFQSDRLIQEVQGSEQIGIRIRLKEGRIELFYQKPIH